jgi:hypothetical protein
MAAAVRPSRDLMRDIAKVAWLPLGKAVKRLSYPLEKLFLQSVGRGLVRRKRRAALAHRKRAKTSRKSKRKSKSAPSAARRKRR